MTLLGRVEDPVEERVVDGEEVVVVDRELAPKSRPVILPVDEPERETVCDVPVWDPVLVPLTLTGGDARVEDPDEEDGDETEVVEPVRDGLEVTELVRDGTEVVEPEETEDAEPVGEETEAVELVKDETEVTELERDDTERL
jgi:hypothetical protein